MVINATEVLKRIKYLVCIEHRYRVSLHVVHDYIEHDLCTYEDIEYCIQHALTINSIMEDQHKEAVDGVIYNIIGKARSGGRFYTTGKFIADDKGEIYFFITAHII